jgi:malate synthase
MGITDDSDTCEVCGKIELRRVMAIAPIDADGNMDGETFYAGSTCGARLISKSTGRRVTAKRLTDAADAASRVLAAAKSFMAEFEDMRLNDYLKANGNALLNVTHGDVDAALDLGRQRYAETVAEARKVLAATAPAGLIGTRFEANLPKL